MQLNRTDTPFSRDERNSLNENWDKIEKEFKGVVDTVSKKAYDQVVDAAKIEWLPPVNTLADIETTYPNATEGKTVMVRDSGKIYRKNDVAEWIEIQDIDPAAINEVDNRLTAQLAENEADVENIKSPINLVPLFDSGEWDLHANVTVDSPTKITLNATGSHQVSQIKVKVISNTNYYINVQTNNTGKFSIFDGSGSNALVGYRSSGVTFNTGDNESIFIYLSNVNTATGTFTFENIMLNEGSEPLPFRHRTREHLVYKVDKNNLIFPEDFGAKGNGTTDDTIAFEKAVQQMGILVLNPINTYLIKNSILVDLTKIKGIQGNNAKVKLDSDIAAFIIKGSKVDGAATPSSNQNIKHEFAPFIDGLHVYSDSYVGTGFVLDGTFGIVINKCHLYGLKRGIELINRNRNVNIAQNNLYDCSEYGIHYNNANVHQSIINNNHISYMKNALFFDNGDVHNVQIVGNDIEIGESPNNNAESAIKVRCTQVNTQFSQVQIVGNSIEDHFLSNNGLINMYAELFDAATLGTDKAPYIGMIELTGNELSGASYALIVEYVFDLTINGNTFKLISDTFITINTGGEGYNITGNTFSGKLKTNYGGMVLKVVGSKSGFNQAIGNMIFSNNSCYYLSKNPVEIRRRPSISEVFEIYELTIANNIFSSAYEKGDTNLLTSYMFDLVPSAMYGVSITGNTFRARSFNEHGLRALANTTNNTIVKDNIIRGLVARGGVQPTNYTLPVTGGTIMIGDNVPVQ